MLETCPTSDALAEAAADGVGRLLAEGLEARGRASLVATGGRSPAPIYDRLGVATDIDWSRVTVTLSDERCVEPGSSDSNQRMVRARLLTGQAAAANFLPLWPQPPDAAIEVLLPFDAVLLGMGEDGHVASLIPGSPVLAEAMDPASGRLAMPVPAGVGSPPLARITLTLPALLQSRAIFLLIAGEAKRGVIARALAGEDLPVRALLVQDRVPVRILWAPSY